MMIVQKIDDKGWNMGNQLLLCIIKECFYLMIMVEVVSVVYYSMMFLVVIFDGIWEGKCVVSYMDDNFWCVFGFCFLYGKFYGQEFVFGEKKLVVICLLVCCLFGIDNVVGCIILLGFVDYIVCGVVVDVLVLVEVVYVEVWVFYMVLLDYECSVSEGL